MIAYIRCLVRLNVVDWVPIQEFLEKEYPLLSKQGSVETDKTNIAKELLTERWFKSEEDRYKLVLLLGTYYTEVPIEELVGMYYDQNRYDNSYW